MPARANRPETDPVATAALAGKQDAASAATDSELLAALNLHALGQRAGARLRRSVAEQRRQYEDTTPWADQFSNLAGWTVLAGNALQASGSRVYFQSGAFPAATRALAAGSATSFRLVGRIKYVAGGGGHQTHIGVLVGSDPTSLGNITSLFVNEAGQLFPFYGGGPQAPIGSLPAAGEYLVTITADESVVSFEISAQDRSYATGFTRTRAQAGSIANALLVVNDARGTGGSGVGPIGARVGSLASIAPRTNIEGVGYTATRTTVQGSAARIELPPGYDSRVPAPLLLGTHGYTGSELEASPNPNGLSGARALFKVFLDLGFIVAWGDAGGQKFGNAEAQTHMANLLGWCLDRYAISGVVLGGISAGGLWALNALTRRVVPAVGAVLLETTPDLVALGERAQAIGGQTSADFRAAYGIAADYSDLEAKVAGYNPLVEPAVAFRGVPILASASPADTSAPLSEVQALQAKLTGYNAFTLAQGSGEHNDPSLFPTSAALVALSWLS